jgi:phage replication-related protein YjqB (UPF0714/DUF867 family)
MSLVDRYANFEALAAHAIEHVDYVIEERDRGSKVAVVGIHGGRIEPVTVEFVRAIAGEDLSYYLFISQREELHLTSSHFDEPRCRELLGKTQTVISVHGKSGKDEFVMVGGLDTALVADVARALRTLGISVIPPVDTVAGRNVENICNQGRSRKGVQLELSRGLRDALMLDPARLVRTAEALRLAFV